MERSVDNGFNDWWSRVLEVHDYASDPNDVEHFYDYKAAFESGIEIPEEGESWPSQFKHDLHPDRYIKGEDVGKHDIDYWDTKYDQPATAIDMIRQTYRREEFLDQKGLFDTSSLFNEGDSQNVQI
jgi:hypothetical protein